jgi:putative MATE family efflux protein
MTEAPLLRASVSFGTPMVIAMALGSLFNLVDLYIVGRMPSPEIQIAAVTIGSLVNSIPMIIFNGIVNAIIALVARFHGLGNLRRANVAAGQGFILTVIMSLAMGIPPFIWAEEICVALGASGDVVAPATEYLEVVSLGTITMFLLMQITGAMRAVGNSMVPLILMGGANLLNVILDVWFIFGGLGLEPMGVVGAAWATVAARGLFAAAGVFLLYRGFAGIRLRRWMIQFRVMWSLLKIGIPSCLQWLVRMVSYLYILSFVAKAAPLAGQGVTEAQAAFGVGLRLDTLALFSGFGWGAAAATLVGQNLGRGLVDRARRATWIALGLNMMMMLIFAGLYVLFADELLAMMGFDAASGNDAGQVMDIGRTYLYVTSSGFVFLAVAVVISQALAGAGATKFPLLIELVMYGVVGYPFVEWAAGHAGEWGLRALWLAAVGLHLAVAILYVLWFHFGPWAKKEIK